MTVKTVSVPVPEGAAVRMHWHVPMEDFMEMALACRLKGEASECKTFYSDGKAVPFLGPTDLEREGCGVDPDAVLNFKTFRTTVDGVDVVVFGKLDRQAPEAQGDAIVGEAA